ncbi:MAG TPA: two-component system response regulator [Elusimicrobia bacterium]|nr:two-component system response regulator [Elusimicrobiota bacterium]
MKIIIVDDNEITRDLMKTLLPSMGHQVVGEACNGNDAAGVFAELRPDLVLLDLVMPGKTGLEALKEILAIDPAAKVIMVTAVQQDGISRELLAAGAMAILNKPFSYAEFEQVLKRFS